MLERFWARRRDDEGFTLIELMVVVLIIGILIAIALPTFLGARQRAQNRAAQSDLRNTLAAAKTFYTDKNTYTGLDASALSAVEPSLQYDTGASASPDFKVSFGVGNVSGTDGQKFGAARMSASGTCYGILDATAGTAAGTYRVTPGTCTGATVAALSLPQTNTW